MSTPPVRRSGPASDGRLAEVLTAAIVLPIVVTFPFWLAYAAVWLLQPMLPRGTFGALVVGGTMVGYGALGLWSMWYESAGQTDRRERRHRRRTCPVCNGQGLLGAVIFTQAPVSVMCDRHRAVSARIAELERSCDGLPPGNAPQV